MKTKNYGIRIQIQLYELCKAADPMKTFSAIVAGALKEKYNFAEFRKHDIESHSNGCTKGDLNEA